MVLGTGQFQLGTEPYVGAALRASGVPREEVFVTTKLPQVFLWLETLPQVQLNLNRFHHPKYVARSFDESLHKLGLDYVDLVVLHETTSDDRLTQFVFVVPCALASDRRVPE
jgi:2,5-diketo-D-gluconate reductase A